jgi:hypothetical protein
MIPRNSHHTAFTLIELVIASAIFMTLMAALLESLAATKRYEATSIIRDDLQGECDSTVRAIAADLASSGWYFYLNPTTPVDYSNASTDRNMRYYPYVRGQTTGFTGSTGYAFPTRVDMTGMNTTSLLTGLSPWTPGLYPGWTYTQVPSLAAALVAQAAQRGIPIHHSTAAINNDPDAASQLRQKVCDLAVELVKPSNDLIFLRGANGAWTSDPAENDNTVPADLVFFPSYSQSAGGGLTKNVGAKASDWVPPPAPLTMKAGMPVYFPSSYTDDGSGGYVHRNSTLPVDDPLYGKPYGPRSWGAFLDDGGAGLAIRMQWETLSADRLGLDPNPGIDDFPLPDDLREFTYALIPSPTGFGRLVRAHTVLATSGAHTLGVEVGNWITDTSATRGYQINKILSDNVVRTVWVTRRHDPTLGVNQIRMRIIFARASKQPEGGQHSLIFRQVDQVFTMQASNGHDDQEAAAALIDIGTDNLPYTF